MLSFQRQAVWAGTCKPERAADLLAIIKLFGLDGFDRASLQPEVEFCYTYDQWNAYMHA